MASCEGAGARCLSSRFEMSDIAEELLAAAHWSRSHDPSEGYAQMLRVVLTHLGVDDVDLGR